MRTFAELAREGTGLLGLLVLCVALAASPARGDGEGGTSEIAVIVESVQAAGDAINDAIRDAGTQITSIVQTPSGEQIIGVTKPRDPAALDSLTSTLRDTTGVRHVESNVCYEIYPHEPNADHSHDRILNTISAPDPAALVGEQIAIPGWDATPLSESTSASGAREFHSTTRDGDATRERGSGDGTQTRPRSATGWDMVPPEEPIPPEQDTDQCNDPTYGPAEKDVEISIDLAHGDPAIFQYPRPLPLQAIARDYDLMKVSCSGCGGDTTTESRYLEDMIGKYKWTIKDTQGSVVRGAPQKLRGSLNKPFSNPDDDNQAKIEKLKKEIREKSAALEKAKAERDALLASQDQRKKDLEEEIAALEAEKAANSARLNQVSQDIGTKQTALDGENRTLADAKQAITELERKIDDLNDEIKELEGKIDGEPSAATRDIARQLEDLERRIEAKQDELERLKADNVNREQSLAQAYDQAIDDLVRARQELANIRAEIVAKQDEILALENKLYSNPALRTAMRLRGNLNRLGSELQSRYLSPGLPPTLDLNNAAMQIFQSPNADARRKALEAFRSEKDRLLASLNQQCAALSGAAVRGCTDQVAELASEAESLDQTLDDAVNNPQSGGSKRDWDKLKDLRDELANLEGSVGAATQRVTTAEQAVNQAQQTYDQALTDMFDAEAQKSSEITDVQLEAQEKSVELAAARAKDEQERLSKTPDWIKEIADKRKQIEVHEAELSAERLKAERAQTAKDRLEAELRTLRREQAELEALLAYIDEQLRVKRERLGAIASETAALDAQISQLESELRDLEEALKNAMAQSAAAGGGVMEAFGQQVFFIPPPLEVTDGFDNATFGDHKKKVAEAESAYERARAAKARLQDEAYDSIKGFTEQLWALKTANATIEGLDGELAELRRERGNRQAEVANARNADIAKEENRKRALDQDKADKETELERKKATEERDKERVEKEEEELKEALDAEKAAKDNVRSKKAEFDAADEARRRTKRQQDDVYARFTRTVNDLRRVEAELGRAQSAVSRASARDDIPGIAANQKEANRLKQQVDDLNRDLDNQRPTLLELDQRYAEKLAATNSAKEAHKAAQLEQKAKFDAFMREAGDVDRANKLLKQSTQERTDQERAVRKADDEVKRQEKIVGDKRAEQDKAVTEDEEVKSKDKEIKDKEGKKTAAEEAKNAAQNKLNELRTNKGKWDTRKEEAEKALDDARKNLEAERKALNDFLHGQFNNVSHRVEIELEVEDAAIDQRAKDEPQKITIKIKYQGRSPNVLPKPKGVEAQLPTPPQASQSTCNVKGEWVPEPTATMQVAVPPTRDRPVGVKGLEPQTIALYYQKGAPLYDEWPPVKPGAAAGGSSYDLAAEEMAAEAAAAAAAAVADFMGMGSGDVPAADAEEDEEVEVLVHSSTPYKTDAVDTDPFSAQCTTGGGDYILMGDQPSNVPSELTETPAGPMCAPGGQSGKDIQDVPHVTWATTTFTSGAEIRTMIKVPEVKPEECEGETEFEVEYLDSKKQVNDTKGKKHKYIRKSGELGDAPPEYKDFGNAKKMPLRFQVYEGGHKGKRDQNVEWKVTSVQPASLKPEQWGLGKPKEREASKPTEGDGYSRIDFILEERWGLATVTAEWKREDKVCATATMQILKPIQLRKLNVGFAPKNGWEQGIKAWKGEGGSFDSLAGGLEGDGPETGPSIAIGLLDEWMDPVNEKKILFSILNPEEAGIDPDEMATREHGLAWSHVKDLPEDAEVRFRAEIEEDLRPVTQPPSVEGEQSTQTINQFRIGPDGKQFTIETEKPFVPGQPVNGGAKLVLDEALEDIPDEFNSLKLEVENVVVNEDGVAQEGLVSWKAAGAGGSPKPFKMAKFEFTLDSLGMSAGVDAKITGKVKIPTKDDQVEFEAVMGPGGFFGRISNFPELEFANVKLEQGAAISLDMHKTEGPDRRQLCPLTEPTLAERNQQAAGGAQPRKPRCGWTGKGLLIEQATLVLPESMKGDAETPPKISVKNFYYNDNGLSGLLSIDYTVAAKLGQVDFAIEKVGIGLQNNELVMGEFAGKMTLADPFHGSVQASLSLDAAGKYAISVGTDKPLTAPSLGLTLMLHKVAAEYSQPEQLFSFEMQAKMLSGEFDEIEIREFKVNSKGDIEADVDVDVDVKIAKRFEAHLGTFYLKKNETEFEFSLKKVGFKFGEVLQAKDANITIVKGPVIESFGFKIEAEEGPVKFESNVNYATNTFSGTADFKLKNLMDIKGAFIVGSQKKEDDTDFKYWYVELGTKTTIALGQTGLEMSEIGGGVGWNYDPPIGDAPGAVRYTDSMSLKAYIGVGNFPGSKVFNSRMTMVLVSGRLSLNGKVWLLTKEESLYGEGQLDMIWEDPAQLKGFVRMVIALPGSDGGLARFTGQVDFKYAGERDWFIKSKELDGAILERVIGEGNIDIQPGKALFEGNLRYDLGKTVPLGVVTLQAQVHLRADGKLEILVTEQKTSVDANVGFKGSVDLTVETKVKNFDLASASLESGLRLKAENRSIKITGEADVEWETWVHSGSYTVDISYSVN